MFRHVKGIDMFLDGPNAKARDSVRVIFAGEQSHADDILSQHPRSARVGNRLRASYRSLELSRIACENEAFLRSVRKDRTHLRDLMDVGLIDETWLPRLPAKLSSRLKELLDNPEELMSPVGPQTEGQLPCDRVSDVVDYIPPTEIRLGSRPLPRLQLVPRGRYRSSSRGLVLRRFLRSVAARPSKSCMPWPSSTFGPDPTLGRLPPARDSLAVDR